jgi:hypothetical protein
MTGGNVALLDGRARLPALAGGPYTFDAGVFIYGTLYVCQQGSCVPTPPAGTNWSFDFATAPCAAFNANQQSGQWIPVVSSNVNPVVFACRLGGTEVVSGSYGSQQGAPDLININAPTPNPNPDTLTDQVAIVQQGEAIYVRAGRTGQVGIELGFDILNMNGASGNIGAIQLVGTTRTLVQNDGTTLILTTGNNPVLDVATGQAGYIYLDRTVAATSPLQISDSPAQQVDDSFQSFTVNENFLTTLMFQSNRSSSSCWVMLFSVVWGWQANATRTGPSQWQLNSGQIEVFGTFTPGYGVPTWNSNINNYSYQSGGSVPAIMRPSFIEQVTRKLTSRRQGA